MAEEAFEFLRKVPLFADLSDEDLQALCQMVDVISLPEGQMLFSEGDLGKHAYIVKQGQVEVFKTLDGKRVQLEIHQPGAVIGEMALLESAPRSASVRAVSDSRLIAINQDEFAKLLNAHPGVTLTMLHTVTSRLRSMELMLGQSEKLAALGTFTAGIAHELNNPAAAVQRGAGQLTDVVSRLQAAQTDLLRLSLSSDQIDYLHKLVERARRSALASDDLDALTRSDREASLEAWLSDHRLADAWELSPVLVNLDFDISSLGEMAAVLPETHLPLFLRFTVENYNLFSLLHEIGQGASRMHDIVKALKSYSYLDQAPVQEVDVHEGLNDTLVILRHKIKDGIRIQREYDPSLPRIQAYGSELNQVWTNLLDNAIDAVAGKGSILIRTAHGGESIQVEIEDDGPGIPVEIQSRIFNPFFTTKPLGKGTGLGLNISYNIVHKHRGDIHVESRPGRTVFQVRLPIDFEKAA